MLVSENRNNCFDVVRHFAALLVLFSHHYALSGVPEPVLASWETYGFVAVVIFFSISGYFMPASFNSSGGFTDFIVKRCRRIFPGLIVCAFLMTYLVGTIFGSTPANRFIFDVETVKTFVLTFSFIGRNVPGVFDSFIVKHAVNGSLWTLPVEFLCYLIFGMALTFLNSVKTILALFLVCVIAKIVMIATGANYSFYAVPMSYLAIFGIAFTAGALLSLTKKSWWDIRFPMVIISVGFLWILQGRPEMPVIGTLSITIITIVLGASFKDRFINGHFDFSYGIYIYAFPIQQIIINLVTRRFWLSMAIAAVLTVIAGYLSYRYVEKPFLKNKKKMPNENVELGNSY